MKKAVLFTCVFLITAMLCGQTSSEHFISATVVGFDGEVLIGASISLVGKPKGAVSDINGNFRISVSNEDVLRVTYAGFQTVELYPEEIEYELKGRIELKEGNWLREVVITGLRGEALYCSLTVIHCFTSCGTTCKPATKDTMPAYQSKKWQYYPNPTTDGVLVSTEDAIGLISVFSSDGKLVLRQKVTDIQTRIDLTGQCAGMYFLNYEGNEEAQAIGQVALVRE